jgi:hypothetical protein
VNRGIRTFGNTRLLLLYNVGALRSGAQRSTPGAQRKSATAEQVYNKPEVR